MNLKSFILARIKSWGAAGLLLLAASLVVPFRYPYCIPSLILQICALACSIVAALRESKWWWILSGITAILVAQMVFAVVVEC
jgi:membrane protein YdbS with pleckstrin-like domain